MDIDDITEVKRQLGVAELSPTARRAIEAVDLVRHAVPDRSQWFSIWREAGYSHAECRLAGSIYRIVRDREYARYAHVPSKTERKWAALKAENPRFRPGARPSIGSHEAQRQGADLGAPQRR